MLVAGRPKTGKSYANLTLAIAVASGGKSWLGFPVQAHGPVLYLQFDAGAVPWRETLENVSRAGYDLTNIHTIDLSDKENPYPFNILDPSHFKWLANITAKTQPLLVVIDTLAAIHRGDENDASTMRNVYDRLIEAIRPAALSLVAHARKMPAQLSATEDVVDDVRGSSAIAGTVDVIFKVSGSRSANRFIKYAGRHSESPDGKAIECYQDPDSAFLMFRKLDEGVKQQLADALRAEHPSADKSWLVKELFLRYGIARSTAYRLLK